MKDALHCQLTFSCSSDLFVESSDDSAGGIMLIKSMGEFLASGLQLLAQGEAMKHDSILAHKTNKTPENFTNNDFLIETDFKFFLSSLGFGTFLWYNLGIYSVNCQSF